MRVLTGLERKIRERLRALSFYDAAVLLILLAFTTLFYSFPMPELHWDSAGMGTSGIFWQDITTNMVVTGRFDNIQNFIEKYLTQYEIHFLFYYPVFWGLVSGFTFFFFGINVGAFYFVILLFALASILATYLLASTLYDRRVGVIASLFLASSHTLFATTKSGSIDIPATAMVTVTMLAFLKAEADKRWTYSVLAGILFGLSFMTKPTTAIAVVVIALYLVLRYARKRGGKIGNFITSRSFENEKIRMGLHNFIIICIPASILILIQMHVWASSNTLSGWLYAFSDPHFSAPWYKYFSWILTEYLSPIIVGLFIIGFVFSLGRRNDSDVFLLTWFIAFISFFSLTPTKEPRYLLTLVPCLSIMAAHGLISTYNLAKEKLEIQRTKIHIRNLTKTLFVLLIVLGIANGVILMQRDPYAQAQNLVDFENVDDSPVDEVAKFLVGKAGVVYILPDYEGWTVLYSIGARCSLPTLKFHILKHDRQRTTYFYGSYGLGGTVSNETLLVTLDWLSEYHENKTVYVVVPYVYNWTREFLELLEPARRAVLEPYQKYVAYIQSHSELIPLVAVFSKGGIEIRVYQRIKGAF